MQNKIKLLLVVLSTAFFVGCNSLENHEYGVGSSEVYPGVRADCEGLSKAHSTGMYAPWIFGYCLIDVPFSIITDTLYLPSDTINAIEEKHRKQHPQTNNVANQTQTNIMWTPTLSPRQQQQWNMLPGP